MTFKRPWNQSPPFCVKIELSEGCNLYCNFCGLQSIRERKIKNFHFMTVETARDIAQQMAALGWKSRIEFAMHGEPTMNPDRAKIVAEFRRALPRAYLMMTSNGGGLLSDTTTAIADLFDAGLNTLAMDDYEGANIVPKILQRMDNAMSEDKKHMNVEDRIPITVYRYPAEPDGNPHTRRKPHERVLTVIQDIERATKGTHSRIHNTAGLSAPRDPAFNHRRCARPFRELSIRHDGRVALCCIDWRGTYKLGSALGEGGLERVWHAPEHYAARTYLGHGQRGKIRTCDGCTSVSYREGLIPDNSGQVRIPKPSHRTAELVAQAESGTPYATPVQRPWEAPTTAAPEPAHGAP